MQIGNNSKEERYMDANTVSLQRQVPMRLCCRDVCRWTLARASLQGWTPQYNQWLVASKKKQNKTKKKKRVTSQTIEKTMNKNETQGHLCMKRGQLGFLASLCENQIWRSCGVPSFLSAPLIDQNENNLWPAHREIVRRFRVATWALKVQRTTKAKRISFTKT